MLVFSKPVAIFAVKQLAAVDYTVANKVTEDVSRIVEWGYENDLNWIPPLAVNALRTFDDLGSVLISLVLFIVRHTP